MFVPTLDWGHELLTSLLWIGQGWLIAAVATLLICTLIALSLIHISEPTRPY